ncbi:hypothetical protein N7495_005817 [Penicillium taxi]|uniref:uncharacterized protein n=1 Tax=Penicillium taxi TaxID=168475 RepID=UPI00254561F1|nr:uncharacterized protein N7495_005817 [Penicillium taxi]KAJ5894126.1 hypothetical protein N7495_005817 [Penicillium taxi]
MDYILDAARIKSLPGDAFYISHFITEEEEASLLQKVVSTPLPRWTQLSHRRLQTWPSALTKTNTLIKSPLPSWLVSPIINPRFQALRIFDDAPHSVPNHVLVNEYHPGQGIMPHEDGSAYYPLVATVSLGASIVLDLYENSQASKNDEKVRQTPKARPDFRILQERRSLLVTRGSIYTNFLHGIAETCQDEDLGPATICNWDLLCETDRYIGGYYQRETRISLTYRDVLRVANIGNAIQFLGLK